MGYQNQEWKCSGLMFKRAGFPKYVANSIRFMNICIYFYSFQKYQKYYDQLATVSFFNVVVGPACLFMQLSGSCEKTLRLLTNQMSPIIS